jgi:heptosyltransferase-2
MSESAGTQCAHVYRRVLFIHTQGGIGDLLLSAPVAEAVAGSWPDAAVTAWVRPELRGLLHGNPSFSGCLSIDGGSFTAQCAAISRRRFDVAILPWTTGRQAALAWLAAIPVRVGQAGRLAYSWTFTHPVEVASAHGDTSTHWIEIQLGYARALGCRTDGVRPRLFLDAREREEARAVLARHGIAPSCRPCGLHIGKGLPLALDRWPVARFVQAGRQIVGAGLPVVLIGSSAERGLAGHVARQIGNGAVVLAGGTARELAALIAEMSVVITPDSGPGHIAAALDVPVVSIFAVKSVPIERWRPWGAAYRVVTTAPWACQKACVKETCPRFDCLEAFDAGEVARAALELADLQASGIRGPVSQVPHTRRQTCDG